MMKISVFGKKDEGKMKMMFTPSYLYLSSPLISFNLVQKSDRNPSS